MALRTYVSINTSNRNGLNAATKRHILAEWIWKQDLYTHSLQKTHFRHKDTYRLNIKSSKKQQVAYKGNSIHLTADLSAETLQARREWMDIFKVLKGKNIQPRLLYLARISFKIDGEIKSFSDKQKLREFSTTKWALQQILKGLNLVKNYKRRKKIYKINPKQLRKWH